MKELEKIALKIALGCAHPEFQGPCLNPNCPIHSTGTKNNSNNVWYVAAAAAVVLGAMAWYKYRTKSSRS